MDCKRVAIAYEQKQLGGIMQEKKVTVVIPNYNGIKYIRDCMDSLRTQEDADFDVLIVDNASKDGSLEVLQEEYKEARIIALSENTGFCHAVNEGIRASRTPYVILLNNDTKVKPGFIKALTEAMERDEKIFSVSSLMLSMQDENIVDDAGDGYSLFGWAYAIGKGKSAEKYNKAREVFAACGGASIYRKAVFEEIGYFDENHFAYLEDMDIGYRARIYGYTNWYEPKAKVLHMGSATSGSRYNEFKTKLASANNAYLIGKNMPLLQWLINLPFLLVGFLVKATFFFMKKMGMLYVKGYFSGIARRFTKVGRNNKVPFKMTHLVNYCKIEIWLILGTFRVFRKY